MSGQSKGWGTINGGKSSSASEKDAGGMIKNEVSLGNILLLLGMLGTIGAGLWEGGQIRASLEGSIVAEKQARVDALAALTKGIDEVKLDVREIRQMFMRDQHTGAQRP